MDPLSCRTARRPLSPHLQIYKIQLTSLLSILHRLTGLVLGLGLAVLTLWVYGAAFEPAWIVAFSSAFHTLWGRLFLGVFLAAFWYHFSNGIRHLVGDTGRWLGLRAAYASGYVVIFMSFILTAITWLWIFS